MIVDVSSSDEPSQPRIKIEEMNDDICQNAVTLPNTTTELQRWVCILEMSRRRQERIIVEEREIEKEEGDKQTGKKAVQCQKRLFK